MATDGINVYCVRDPCRGLNGDCRVQPSWYCCVLFWEWNGLCRSLYVLHVTGCKSCVEFQGFTKP